MHKPIQHNAHSIIEDIQPEQLSANKDMSTFCNSLTFTQTNNIHKPSFSRSFSYLLDKFISSSF